MAYSSSGKASVTKLSKSSKIAKMVYKYGIEKEWFVDKDHANTGTAKSVLGLSYDTVVTKQRLVECFCQISTQGKSTWKSVITSSSGGGWNPSTAQAVLDFYDAEDIDKIVVPDSFEIWKAEPEEGQSFIFWKYESTGKLKLEKVSSNTSITG